MVSGTEGSSAGSDMRKSVAPRGATGGQRAGRLFARSGVVSFLVAVLAVAMVGNQPGSAQATSHPDPGTSRLSLTPSAPESLPGDPLPSTSSIPAMRGSIHANQGLFALTPSLSSVFASDRTRNSASILAYVRGLGTTPTSVHLRYQETSTYPTGTWSTETGSAISSEGTERFELTGLKHDTEYSVEVSLDSGFASGVKLTKFRTLRPPTVTYIGILSITDTTATVNVEYRRYDAQEETFRVRYRVSGTLVWTGVASRQYSGNKTPVPVVLTGLSASTTYQVEASLNATGLTLTEDWPGSRLATFTTKDASATLPDVSTISVEELTACSARLNIGFPNPNSESFVVYYRWKSTESGANWSATGNYPTRGNARVQISLAPSTTYVAQATLDPKFEANIFESEEFTTGVSPYVSNVVADPVGATTATLTATRSNFCRFFPTYHFRYRVKETETWTTSAAEDRRRYLDLTGLTPSTTYEAEVSFHHGFSHPFKIEFRTRSGTPDPLGPTPGRDQPGGSRTYQCHRGRGSSQCGG